MHFSRSSKESPQLSSLFSKFLHRNLANSTELVQGPCGTYFKTLLDLKSFVERRELEIVLEGEKTLNKGTLDQALQKLVQHAGNQVCCGFGPRERSCHRAVGLGCSGGRILQGILCHRQFDRGGLGDQGGEKLYDFSDATKFIVQL